MRAIFALVCICSMIAAASERVTIPRSAGRYLPSFTDAYTVVAQIGDNDPVDVLWVISYADARLRKDGLLDGLTKVLPSGGVWRCPVAVGPELGCVVNVVSLEGCRIVCGEESREVSASSDLQVIEFKVGGEVSIESTGPVEVDLGELVPVELIPVVAEGVRGVAVLRVRVVDDKTIEYSTGGEPVCVRTDIRTGGVFAEGSFVGGPFPSRSVAVRPVVVKGWRDFPPRTLSAKPRKTVRSGLDAGKR